MRALIIGGAGYIGSHVARHFLDNGHQVIARGFCHEWQAGVV